MINTANLPVETLMANLSGSEVMKYLEGFQAQPENGFIQVPLASACVTEKWGTTTKLDMQNLSSDDLDTVLIQAENLFFPRAQPSTSYFNGLELEFDYLAAAVSHGDWHYQCHPHVAKGDFHYHSNRSGRWVSSRWGYESDPYDLDAELYRKTLEVGYRGRNVKTAMRMESCNGHTFSTEIHFERDSLEGLWHFLGKRKRSVDLEEAGRSVYRRLGLSKGLPTLLSRNRWNEHRLIRQDLYRYLSAGDEEDYREVVIPSVNVLWSTGNKGKKPGRLSFLTIQFLSKDSFYKLDKDAMSLWNLAVDLARKSPM